MQTLIVSVSIPNFDINKLAELKKALDEILKQYKDKTTNLTLVEQPPLPGFGQ